MNNRCVVSFGKNYNFERGLKRLKACCETYNIPFEGFTEYPDGCPIHEVSPYAFKFYCIQECLKKGYTQIIWLDTSVVINKSIDDLFTLLDNQGYFFIYNHELGPFCHDKALETLQITREESFKLPCLQGTNFGLNFNFESVKLFFEDMLVYANDGITFPGPHNNDKFLASKDPRVRGHRFDQIAMSVASLRRGLNNWLPYGSENYWFTHDRNYVKDVVSTVPDIDMSI